MSNDISKKFKEFKEEGYLDFITFHPSYSYEEFIEGITVHTEKEGVATKNIQYKLKSGIFKSICKRALGSAIGLAKNDVENKTWNEVYLEYLEKTKEEKIDFDSAKKHILIIDEINRGDMSKIFGELITLLENDKRLGGKNELSATLPYSNDTFGVPPNVYIIGTMNTADRSIALLDVALRRRFGFEEMTPNFDIVQDYLDDNKVNLENKEVYELLFESKKALEKINERICDDRSIGRDKQIGHSYLLQVQTIPELMMAWQNEILPLLEEYCYGNYDKINTILFKKDGDSNWIKMKEGIKGFEATNDLETLIEEINISD